MSAAANDILELWRDSGFFDLKDIGVMDVNYFSVIFSFLLAQNICCVRIKEAMLVKCCDVYHTVNF